MRIMLADQNSIIDRLISILMRLVASFINSAGIKNILSKKNSFIIKRINENNTARTVDTKKLVLTIFKRLSLSPLAWYSATYLVTERPNPASRRFVFAEMARARARMPYVSLPNVFIR